MYAKVTKGLTTNATYTLIIDNLYVTCSNDYILLKIPYFYKVSLTIAYAKNLMQNND